MLENKMTKNGIQYSRIIASWLHEKNKKSHIWYDFRDWLESLKLFTDDEIDDIFNMATLGKMELEMNAMYYLNNKKKKK